MRGKKHIGKLDQIEKLCKKTDEVSSNINGYNEIEEWKV